MHNRFVRVAFGILTVLGTLVLVAVAALGVATRPGPDGVGRLAGHPVLTILSGSMSPAFDTGDVVVDRVVPASGTTTLHSGDVITFRAPAAAGATSSVLITHRITAVIRSAGGATLYVTRGDHNQTDDPTPVPASSVVAVYQFHVPLAGYLLRFAHTPPGFTALLLAPVVWLVAFELVRMWRRTPRAAVSGRAGHASHEEAPLMP